MDQKLNTKRNIRSIWINKSGEKWMKYDGTKNWWHKKLLPVQNKYIKSKTKIKAEKYLQCILPRLISLKLQRAPTNRKSVKRNGGKG